MIPCKVVACATKDASYLRAHNKAKASDFAILLRLECMTLRLDGFVYRYLVSRRSTDQASG